MSVKGPILVVDDEEDILQYLLEVFQDNDMEAIGVSDVKTASVEVLKRPPALILLDIMMPGHSGLHFYRAIRENPGTAEIPILFISGYSKAEDFGTFQVPGMEGFELGPSDGFLEKPIKVPNLLERVHEFLGMSSEGGAGG